MKFLLLFVKTGMASRNNKQEQLREEAKMEGKIPGRNISEKSDIEQTRIENRREADLEDKTPAGDAGPEDASKNKQQKDPLGESNY